MNTNVAETTEKVVPQKSKGQLYKEKYGISKTMKRNMKKKGLDTSLLGKGEGIIATYKQLRKARKKDQKKAQHKKLEASQLHRRLNPRKKKNNGGAKKNTEIKIMTS